MYFELSRAIFKSPNAFWKGLFQSKNVGFNFLKNEVPDRKPLNSSPGGHSKSIFRRAAAQNQRKTMILWHGAKHSPSFSFSELPFGENQRIFKNLYFFEVFGIIVRWIWRLRQITFKCIFKYISNSPEQSPNPRMPSESLCPKAKMLRSNFWKFSFAAKNLWILAPVGIQNQFFAALPRKIKDKK